MSHVYIEDQLVDHKCNPSIRLTILMSILMPSVKGLHKSSTCWPLVSPRHSQHSRARDTINCTIRYLGPYQYKLILFN